MKIILAVSGGIDSMYMLARSEELFPGDSFAVAHCNFGLRAQESDGDEAFVRAFCAKAGLPLFVKRFNTKAYALEKGISIEMAARELRYAWFEALLVEESFDAVAVAHNSNDNAETLLLNLLRGTGSRGLRGMGERSLGFGGKVLRPLLSISREEICAWMMEHGVAHREDSSNAECEYKRNKLRNLVFPVFKEINPAFLRTLSSDMRHFAQVDDIADSYFRSVVGRVFDGGAGRASGGASGSAASGAFGGSGVQGSIYVSALLALEHWEYVLFRILEPFGFSEATIKALAKLISGGTNGGSGNVGGAGTASGAGAASGAETFSGKTFEAPYYKAITAAGRVDIYANGQVGAKEKGGGEQGGAKGQDYGWQEQSASGFGGLIIPAPGTYEFKGQSISVKVYDRPSSLKLKRPSGQLIADASALPFPLRLRSWQDGDYLHPLGLGGKKKLSDLFVDLKWSLPQKEAAIVLDHPDGKPKHLGALLCERIDDSLKISPYTKKVVELNIKK